MGFLIGCLPSAIFGIIGTIIAGCTLWYFGEPMALFIVGSGVGLVVRAIVLVRLDKAEEDSAHESGYVAERKKDEYPSSSSPI